MHEYPAFRSTSSCVCYDRAQYAAVQSTRTSQKLCLPQLPSTFEEPAARLSLTTLLKVPSGSCSALV